MWWGVAGYGSPGLSVPCHVLGARRSYQSCTELTSPLLPGCTTMGGGGVCAGKSVHGSTALFFLVGLDIISTDQLGWKGFFQPFFDIWSEDFTARWAMGVSSGLRGILCQVMVGCGMLRPFASILCP